MLFVVVAAARLNGNAAGKTRENITTAADKICNTFFTSVTLLNMKTQTQSPLYSEIVRETFRYFEGSKS
jgi:hypothetical protein